MAFKVLRTLFHLSLFLLVSGFIALLILFIQLSSELPQIPKSLEVINLSLPTEIYSDNGNLVYRLGGRQRISLEKISVYFIQAIIATEDRQFYEHHGVNKRGVLRAIASNVKSGKIIQGGSSITQQLAKNLFFTFKKTWKRKIYELLIALQFESAFTKDNIIEAYCNQIYFGSGAYGIEEASQTFFGKHADELNLPEASLLAGLPNYPSRYNPYVNEDLAIARQKKVLLGMLREGFITEEEMSAAIEFPLVFYRSNEISKQNSYYVNYVTDDVEKRYGKELLYYGGLKIFTTLDSRMQGVAQKVVRDHLEYLDKLLAQGVKRKMPDEDREEKKFLQGALVAVSPGTGAIKAMVGGRDISRSQFNRAVSNNRQPGSGFKPFVYLTALQKLGFSPATTVKDEEVIFKIRGSNDWKPVNFSNKFIGNVTLKKALINSINVISAKLIDQVGVDAVIENAKKFGIKSELEKNLSLALGTSAVSPLEMASAFAVFASEGLYSSPFAIKRIEDSNGNVLEEKFPTSRRVFDPELVYLMVDMMKGVVDEGTARKVRRMGFTRPAGGKTGTTNDFKDAWFTGFVPTLSASVWVGYDDATPMENEKGRKITGSLGGVPIWTNFMKEAIKNEPVKDFPVPSGIEFVEINPETGFAVSKSDKPSKKLKTAIKKGTILKQRMYGFESD